MKWASFRLFAFVASILFVSCTVKDAEVGPYTVSTIDKGVYHIQDYNSAYPAGEVFDSEGKITHFNNCSDMYLIVGKDEALLIDLSNDIKWADNAAESLRKLVAERTEGKPLTITFTHNHGDHIGMIPAFADDPYVRYALPETDFTAFAGRFPEDRQSFTGEGDVFELGGQNVEVISVPGHTDGSVVFYHAESNILFTGDAIGSGHGVWIFNEKAFANYIPAVQSLVAWLENPANGVDIKSLRVFGGHYWQRDWLPELGEEEMGMSYIRDMEVLIDEMLKGTAATEPSGLDHKVLDTYFRHRSAIVVWNAAQAEQFRNTPE